MKIYLPYSITNQEKNLLKEYMTSFIVDAFKESYFFILHGVFKKDVIKGTSCMKMFEKLSKLLINSPFIEILNH